MREKCSSVFYWKVVGWCDVAGWGLTVRTAVPAQIDHTGCCQSQPSYLMHDMQLIWVMVPGLHSRLRSAGSKALAERGMLGWRSSSLLSSYRVLDMGVRVLPVLVINIFFFFGRAMRHVVS